MIKGHVLNNSGRSKHIFKRTVYPGQRVPLSYICEIVPKKIEEDGGLIEWIKERLPPGWELSLEGEFEAPVAPSSVDSVDLLPKEPDPEEERESLEYAPLKVIDNLTAKDIYNLRMKDNPKRVIKQITSVHKLRRALTLCLNDSRKSMLATIIRHRIRSLNQ